MRPRGPVFVVDDDEPFCAMLVAVLEHAGYDTRQLTTGEEALARACDEPPGLVILDVSLPGICGYEVCRRLREEFGDRLPIVFVSGEGIQSFDKVAGFLVGGDDYLVKPFAIDELLARVGRLVQRSRPQGAAAEALTKREVEVLSLLAEGLSQCEIASRLFVSRKTVGTHTERIFKKLGIHSRGEAIAFAFREGLVGIGSRRTHSEPVHR